jgi:DNA-binding PucR family transcriptional regulator
MDDAEPRVAGSTTLRNQAAFIELGLALRRHRDEFAAQMHREMLAGIDGLPHDEQMRDLLMSSVLANIETAERVYLGEVPVSAIEAPDDALVYARRLAHLDGQQSVLPRAYRWGQFMLTVWATDEFHRILDDPRAENEALEDLNRISFSYVDQISEQALTEYQAERDRWQTHRSTVKAETLDRLLDRDAPLHGPDLVAAERKLGYQLQASHVAGTVWIDDSTDSPSPEVDSADLERHTRRLAAAAGAKGEALFRLRDSTTAWWWVHWPETAPPPADAFRLALAESDVPLLRLALGGPGHGVEGFRESHHDALAAERVSVIAGSAAPRVVSTTEPGVRCAAMLAADLSDTKRLVQSALRNLAADTPTNADLRETLRVYLEEQGSHSAAARRLHIHKNTVGYRLAKASDLSGGALTRNRVDTELALVACDWLGPAVLLPAE